MSTTQVIAAGPEVFLSKVWTGLSSLLQRFLPPKLQESQLGLEAEAAHLRGERSPVWLLPPGSKCWPRALHTRVLGGHVCAEGARGWVCEGVGTGG